MPGDFHETDINLHSVIDFLAIGQDLTQTFRPQYVPQRSLGKEHCGFVRVLHVCNIGGCVPHSKIYDSIYSYCHAIFG